MIVYQYTCTDWNTKAQYFFNINGSALLSSALEEGSRFNCYEFPNSEDILIYEE